MINVVLVDDDVLIRAGVRMILEAETDIAVLGEASSGRDAVELVRRSRPDVVLMDVEMHNGDGIAATREIVAASDDTRVLILTTFDSDEYLFESLRAGASGFLLKRCEPSVLLEGVRVVARGEAIVASSMTVRLIEAFTRTGRTRHDHGDRLELLTERETEVLTLVARGHTNGEIAAVMHVSESTAKTHLKRILMKLGLRDRVAAAIFAHEAGIIQASG